MHKALPLLDHLGHNGLANCKSKQFRPHESREILLNKMQTRQMSNGAMKCPHCGQEIGISTAALADDAVLLRTQCEKCGKEFLIVEGAPMTDEQYSSYV